jgi:hypothetical protein
MGIVGVCLDMGKNPTIFFLTNVRDCDIATDHVPSILIVQPSAFRRYMVAEGITDAQLIVDQQSVLHILGVQCFAFSEKSGGDDHRIIHAKFVTLSYK